MHKMCQPRKFGVRRVSGSSRQLEARLARHAWRVRAFQQSILPWFRREGRTFPWRDKSASHYVLAISEVLLQRTRAETVATFFPLFAQRFPGWNQLARASDEELQALLEPVGLWRRRADSLRALAREMRSRRGRFPVSRDEIEELPGIGQYIASAVLLLCHGSREPMLDVNMARVLERCFFPRKLADIRYDPWLQSLSRCVTNHERTVEINWAILDLASKVCLSRRPTCNVCPLRACCRYAKINRVSESRTPSKSTSRSDSECPEPSQSD
jgi:A/G-specific adenine glycosylase